MYRHTLPMSHPVFGASTLLRGSTRVSCAEAFEGKRYILCYFSASWCGPCKAFTPKLKEWYSSHASKDSCELVFISGDESEEKMEAYYKGMPWLALPFEYRDLEEELGVRFKVRGIPTLVVLDAATGDLITDKGRQGVELKPDDIPWSPILKESATVMEALGLIGTLSRADGTSEPVSSLAGKPFALYMSASWCPPCQKFTPMLKELYASVKARGVPFEVVFVSSDRTLESFTEYFGTHPWLSLPYSHASYFGVKEFLQEKLQVDGMPTLVMFDAQGEVALMDATGKVSMDSKGEHFPWPPTPWCTVEDAMETINEAPFLVALVDLLEGEGKDGTLASAKALLDAVAAPHFKDGKPSKAIRFTLGTDEGRGAPSVRHFCGLASDEEMEEAMTSPRFVIIDVPAKKKFLLPAALGGTAPRSLGLPTVESLTSFVAQYLEGKAEPMSIMQDVDPDAKPEESHGHSHGGAPCGGHGH